eukprot:952541-Prorocentrum_minimum.AAC.2
MVTDGNGARFGQVVILPKLKDFNELIRFPTSQLSKFFKRGDHVKVTTGRHEGDTGMVVQVTPSLQPPHAPSATNPAAPPLNPL